MSRLGTEDFVGIMRGRCIDLERQRVLVSDIAGSAQAADLSLPPNCKGLGRIRHFRSETASGWPANFLPALPASRWLERLPTEKTKAQVFQIAGCALRCWYCYVPYNLLSGNKRFSRWASADDLLDLYLAEEDRPDIIDLSGGAPELVPEWISWMIAALRSRGLEKQVFLWSDDSLSTDILLNSAMQDVLRSMEGYGGFAKVCCLKGISPQSFAFSTGASEEGFERQVALLKSYLQTGISVYGYITLAFPKEIGIQGSIDRLLDQLQSADETFPMRIVPLRVERFPSMASRETASRNEAIRYQDEVVQLWCDSLARRKLFPPYSEAPARG